MLHFWRLQQARAYGLETPAYETCRRRLMYLNGLTLARRQVLKEVRAQPEQYYPIFCSSRNLSGFLTQTLDPRGMLLVFFFYLRQIKSFQSQPQLRLRAEDIGGRGEHLNQAVEIHIRDATLIVSQNRVGAAAKGMKRRVTTGQTFAIRHTVRRSPAIKIPGVVAHGADQRQSRSW